LFLAAEDGSQQEAAPPVEEGWSQDPAKIMSVAEAADHEEAAHGGDDPGHIVGKTQAGKAQAGKAAHGEEVLPALEAHDADPTAGGGAFPGAAVADQIPLADSREPEEPVLDLAAVGSNPNAETPESAAEAVEPIGWVGADTSEEDVSGVGATEVKVGHPKFHGSCEMPGIGMWGRRMG